jgi:ankyrin repeat protein
MIGEDKTKQNIRNLSPLSIAILKGSLEIMDFFINLPGLGVNAKDELGRTSLHYSCETDF